jgi:hypothetical protein
VGKAPPYYLNGRPLQARASGDSPLHICVNISEAGFYFSYSSGRITRLNSPPKRHQFPFLSLPVELRHITYRYLRGEAADTAEMNLTHFRKSQKRNKDVDSRKPTAWNSSSHQLLGTQNRSGDFSPQELAITIRRYRKQLLPQVSLLSASKEIFHVVRQYLHTIPLRL